MQKKLKDLQQEHLDAFQGQTLGAAKPKLSRLERERAEFKAKRAVEN